MSRSVCILLWEINALTLLFHLQLAVVPSSKLVIDFLSVDFSSCILLLLYSALYLHNLRYKFCTISLRKNTGLIALSYGRVLPINQKLGHGILVYGLSGFLRVES